MRLAGSVLGYQFIAATECFAEGHARDQFVEHERARLWDEELNFALVDPADHEIVLGGARLYDVDLARRCAAIGYWLLPDARGRGVVTHAVRLIARWAFEKLNLVRLELTCAPDNDASQRVAELCGFTREGVLRAHSARARAKGHSRVQPLAGRTTLAMPDLVATAVPALAAIQRHARDWPIGA